MPTHYQHIILSIIFIVFWSAGFAFAKMGLNNAPPFTLLFLRYFFASIVFLIIFIIIRPPLPTSRRTWGNIMMTGVMIQFVFFAFVYHAMIKGITAGTVAMIVSMQPILVGILAPYFTKENISKSQWVGLLLGLIGTLVVLDQTSQISFNQLNSIVLTFLALFTMTFVTLFEKRSKTNAHPISVNFIQYTLALCITAPLAFFFEHFNFTLNSELIFSLTFLVVCNSFISITILLYLIRNGESHKVSALFFLVPPVAAMIAFILLGESLSMIALLGIAITTIGVLLVRR